MSGSRHPACTSLLLWTHDQDHNTLSHVFASPARAATAGVLQLHCTRGGLFHIVSLFGTQCGILTAGTGHILLNHCTIVPADITLDACRPLPSTLALSFHPDFVH